MSSRTPSAAHVPGRSSIPTRPCTHTSSGAVQRSPTPAAMSSLIAALTNVPPASSSRITPAMMMLSSRCACMVSGPPTFISTSSATCTRPWPVCSSSNPSTVTSSRPATTSRFWSETPTSVRSSAPVRRAPRAANCSIDSARSSSACAPSTPSAGVNGDSPGRASGSVASSIACNGAQGERSTPSSLKSSEPGLKPSPCSAPSPSGRSSSAPSPAMSPNSTGSVPLSVVRASSYPPASESFYEPSGEMWFQYCSEFRKIRERLSPLPHRWRILSVRSDSPIRTPTSWTASSKAGGSRTGTVEYASGSGTRTLVPIKSEGAEVEEGVDRQRHALG